MNWGIAFIALSLILFGEHIKYTLILLQTLRVTVLTIIISNFDYLREVFFKIRQEIEKSHAIKSKIRSKINLFKTLVNKN